MSRYRNDQILLNSSEYYKPLRETRGLKVIRQYETPMLTNPSVADRTRITADTYLWGYGDRLYKLAYQYYGDARFWWVIAWWNGIPAESEIPNGAVIAIPINIEDALKALGVA
jgi:hypothetical protein|tara:strand:- start:858 stop:1196 length:339 start_codon:yes stop_codon:yes gene_type:complete